MYETNPPDVSRNAWSPHPIIQIIIIIINVASELLCVNNTQHLARETLIKQTYVYSALVLHSDSFIWTPLSSGLCHLDSSFIWTPLYLDAVIWTPPSSGLYVCFGPPPIKY